MKCQSLLSGKNKKNIVNLSSAESDQVDVSKQYVGMLAQILQQQLLFCIQMLLIKFVKRKLQLFWLPSKKEFIFKRIACFRSKLFPLYLTPFRRGLVYGLCQNLALYCFEIYLASFSRYKTIFMTQYNAPEHPEQDQTDTKWLGKKVTSRKHAYIILTPLNPLLYSKTEVYRGIHYFSYFCSKHRLWVLVRTASSRQF